MDFRAKDGIFHWYFFTNSLCLQQFFTGLYNKELFENRI